MATRKIDAKSALGDTISQILMVCGTLFAVVNGLIPSLATLIYGSLTDELNSKLTNCTPINFKINVPNVAPKELLWIDNLSSFGINSSSIVGVLVNGTSVDVRVLDINTIILRNVKGVENLKNEKYLMMKKGKRLKGNKPLRINKLKGQAPKKGIKGSQIKRTKKGRAPFKDVSHDKIVHGSTEEDEKKLIKSQKNGSRVGEGVILGNVGIGKKHGSTKKSGNPTWDMVVVGRVDEDFNDRKDKSRIIISETENQMMPQSKQKVWWRDYSNSRPSELSVLVDLGSIKDVRGVEKSRTLDEENKVGDSKLQKESTQTEQLTLFSLLSLNTSVIGKVRKTNERNMQKKKSTKELFANEKEMTHIYDSYRLHRRNVEKRENIDFQKRLPHEREKIWWKEDKGTKPAEMTMLLPFGSLENTNNKTKANYREQERKQNNTKVERIWWRDESPGKLKELTTITSLGYIVDKYVSQTPVLSLTVPKIHSTASMKSLPDNRINTFTRENILIQNQTKHRADNANVANANVIGVNKTNANATGVNVTQAKVTSANVTQANITGANITKPNVTGVNVTQANITGANITQANVSTINVTQANIIDVNIIQANVTGSNLTQTNVTSANVTSANVTSVNVIQLNVIGANITKENVTGTNVTQANVTGTNGTQANVTGANITKANVTGANFTQAKITGANITEPNVTGANFSQAKITGANITQSNVTGVNVTQANVTGANITQINVSSANVTTANVTSVNVIQSNVTGANISKENVTGTNVTQANVTGANITKANVTGTNVTQTNVTRANVTQTNVTDANFTQANVTGTNITKANVTGANVTQTNVTDANVTQEKNTGANVTQPNVNSINVIQSNVTGANITKGNVIGTNTTKANVTGANVTKANATDANLIQEIVTGPNITKENVTASNVTQSNITAENVTKANVTGPNITKANVTGANVSQANVTFANVTQANVTSPNITMAKINVTGTNVTQANVTGANVLQLNVTGANVTQANITGTNVTQANVSGANVMKLNVTGANETQANVTGPNITKANVTGSYVTQANVTGANVTQANVTGANVTQSNVTGANVTQANISTINVTKANVTGANVTQANVTFANVTQANVTGPNMAMAKINVTGANVTQANVTGPNMTMAKINVTGAVTQANVTGANVTQANVTGTNVTQANVTGANINQANVTGANETQTNVTVIVIQSNVTGANITQANVTGVVIQANVTGANVTQANVTGINITRPNVTGINVTKGNIIGANISQANVTGVNVTQPNVTGINVTKGNITSPGNFTVGNVTEGVTTINITQTNVTGINVTQANITQIKASRIIPKIGKSSVTIIVRNGSKSCVLDEEELELRMRRYAVYYVYAALVTLCCAYGQIVCWNVASERGARELNIMASEDVLGTDPSFYDTQIHKGASDVQDMRELPALKKEDIDALRGGIGGEIAFLIQNLSSCTSGFVISLIKNWKLTLVMLMAAPFMGAVEAFVAKVEKYVKERKKTLQDQAGVLAGKGMRSIKTVVAFAGQMVEKDKFATEMEQSGKLSKLKSFVKGFEKGTNTLVAFSFLGLGFWYSTTMLPSGGITPGALLTIFMAIIGGMMKMAGSSEQIDDVGDSKVSLESILGFSSKDTDPAMDMAVDQLDSIMGKLEIFNVYFHYPSRPEYQILKSVNITAEAGQTVAVLGDTNSGKGTITKLLQGQYDAETGKVRLDGHDLRTLNKRWLRRQLGVVHKHPEFFRTTIADNISYGKDEQCTLKEIVRAAKAAGAHEFISHLPQGYETILTDDGSPLTALQLHLLALARALIRDPKILLWEEDISLMDPDELRTLSFYLDQARRGRTTIISTSHVSVARLADVIIVLHDGRVIEEGTPDELMQSGRAFRYLRTVQYFEAKAAQEDSLLKSAGLKAAHLLEPTSDNSSDEDAYDYYKSFERPRYAYGSGILDTIREKREEVKEVIQSKKEEIRDNFEKKKEEIKELVQQKIQESEAQYKILKMQLLDAPLLIAAALGAALSGMIAPGLAMLFSEIQKFLNDSERVVKEGPFYASMFVVLGTVVAFGGTIEKFMTTLVNEKLKIRLQKVIYEQMLQKNSVPKVPPAVPHISCFDGISDVAMPTDDLKLREFDQHTEVIPAPFRSDCKATPPGTPPEEEAIDITEDDIPGEGDIIPDLDSAPVEDGVVQESGDYPEGSSDESTSENTNNYESTNVPRAKASTLPKTGAGNLALKTEKTDYPSASNSTGKAGYPSVPSSTGKTGLPKGPTDPSIMARSAYIPDPNDLESMADVYKLPGSDLLPLIDPEKQAREAVEKMQRDVEATVQKSIAKYIGPEVQAFISSLLTFYVAFSTGWKMTLVALAGYPIIVLSHQIQQKKTDESVKPKEMDIMKTGLKKMATISCLGMEGKFAKKFKDGAMEQYKHAVKKIVSSGLAFAVGQAMVFIIYAIALRYGCFLITKGEMGAIQVLSVLMSVLFGSFANSSSQAPAHASRSSKESTNRLFDNAPNPNEPIQVISDADMDMGKASGEIKFHHAELPDPLRKGNLLLNDLDIVVNQGQTLAMVLMDNETRNPFEILLERYYDPSCGRVFIDGRDLRSLDIRWLRSQMAVVSPITYLPHHTIAQNIAYGDNTRDISYQEIEGAAYSANAHYFIMRLPEGYDTIPEDQGIHLTCSERMRLAVARAIVRDPSILIIEEPENTDPELDEALQNLSRGRTRLVVARQRKTVDSADKIALVYRGRVLEQGSRQELLARRSLLSILTNHGQCNDPTQMDET